MRHLRMIAPCILWLAALASLADAQTDARVLYLTPYANQDDQIAEIFRDQGRLSRFSTTSPIYYVEPPAPETPGQLGYPAVRVRDDTGRLDGISGSDWSRIRSLTARTSAPVQILFPDGVEFTIRLERGELVAVQTAAKIGPLPFNGTPRAPFAIDRAVAIASVSSYDDFANPDFSMSLLFNLGEPVIPDPASAQGLSGGLDCGPANGWERTHCALYAVRLISGTVGTSCTGTLVSDRHVLTAAHCLCDEVSNGTLSPGFTASIGIPGAWSALELDPSGVHFFDRTGWTVCPDTGLLLEDRRHRGDLAILTVKDGSLASAVVRLKSLGIAPATARRVRAPLPGPDTGPEIWSNQRSAANVFVTFGYGVGRDGNPGKRSMKYTFRHLADCAFGDSAGAPDCDGLQEAIFHDEAFGLCAGDSGSGVFKWAEGSRDGFGNWVLMGVVAGYINLANCHHPDNDALLEVQYERNIVRLDTGLVQAWIDEIVEPGATWQTTALLSPPDTVAGGDN